jgi:predicted extracellular nuclease
MRIPVAFLFLFIISYKSYAQHDTNGVRIMFYNVENFFDTSDDSLKEDNEFLPDGVMRWNSKRYYQKLNGLYKTIIAAGEWSPPDIIAFCEIEKRDILKDLLYKTYLNKFGYEIIHEESPDRRGIDVCLIFRTNGVRLIYYKYLIPKQPKTEVFTSRSILYSKFLIGNDTIHMFVNHWPSRRGGVLAGEENRQDISNMIRSRIDSVIEINQNAKILILGDFNCTPEDKIIHDFLKSSDSLKSLNNLTENLSGKGIGTYRYAGSWEMIDQIMVTRSLLNCMNGLFTSQTRMKILKPDFLLQNDAKYPGLSPFPTYRGYKYVGGYSDHLPILIDLNFRR